MQVCLSMYDLKWTPGVQGLKLKDLKPELDSNPLLKTPENRKVFRCYQGVEKGCIGSKWVKLQRKSF